MSAIPPGASGALLDQDTPDTIRLSVAEATALGERALRGVGLPDDDVCIIVDQLIDNALCGYPFASLPRILAIAQDAKTHQARQPVRVVHETPCVGAPRWRQQRWLCGGVPRYPGRHRQGAGAPICRGWGIQQLL